MVPNSWGEYKLSDLCEKIAVGLAISVTPYMRNTGTKLIRNQNIKRNFFNTKSVVYVDNEFAEKNKSKKVYAGDVVAVRTGSNIGEACVIPEEFDGALTFTTLIARPVHSKLSSEFLGLHINSERGISEVNRLMAGGGKPNLNSGELKKYKLLTPPIAEQRKIALILSTWDKAISTTERLIDNSKQQKKALMQQLLTGKKRLLDDAGKPFEGEWEVVTLQQVATYRRGSFPQPYGNPEWVDEVNGYPFVQVYDIAKNMKLKPSTKIKISDAAISKSVFIPKETIIVSLQGSIGRVAVTQYDAYVDRTILLFQKFLVPMNTVFFAYVIQELFDIEKTKAPGGTIKTITKDVLSNFKILIPSLKEQKKIASVLTNADKEIQLIEQQLTDLKQEKKALMQQLLTGKRRVKTDDTEAA
jgi:type I restriction enzyme S subunit